MKITVLGAGSWGATLAVLLFENGHDVTLWEFDSRKAKDLQDRKIKPFEAGADLPSGLVVANDMKSFKNSEAILFVVPSQHMRSMCTLLKNNGI